MNRHHTTVVGGGAIGLSVAWELSRRGYRVTLIDQSRVGRATSWAATGILPPANQETATDPIDQLRGLSHRLFPDWVRELQTLTSIDCELRRCGGWYLADTRGERASMQGMALYWHDLGIQCDSVAPKELARREPALKNWVERSRDVSAWWVPDEYRIRSPRYLQALEKACQSSGVNLIENAKVTDLRDSGGATETFYQDQWHPTDSLVVTSGAWTGRVAQSLNLQLSIVPVRGQILLLKTDTPTTQSVLNVGQRYVVCRDDGHTLVGSTEEEAGFEIGTTEPVLRSLHDFAITLLPALESARQVGAWSGIRPMTFDGFPMIGQVPGFDHVYVAAGHFRSGIHLSPGTATVIADLIDGNQPAMELESFRVGKKQPNPDAPFREIPS